MERKPVSDDVIAEILDESVAHETISSLWSTFTSPENSPGDTLRGAFAPGYDIPDILPKIVAFPGDAAPPDADYAILSKLGEGGMGVVFEARQNHLSRAVALKMIRPERAGDPLVRNCFFYEATITARLEHPGIIPILEFGRAQDGRDFYTMKKANGVPWSRVLRDRTLEKNLEIFERVLDIVAYAHSRGVLHRDLKPANVLLGDFGEVWLGDWGLAVTKGPDGSYSHAHPGGTPCYMPPEMAVCDAASQGPASDIYLLGAILFEIVTGKPPHMGRTPMSALFEAANNAIAGAGGSGLLSVADKAMAQRPGDRYRHVAELRRAVRDCLSRREGMTLLEQADGELAEAQRLGLYERYQRAVATYESALAAFPENKAIRTRKDEALRAYAGQALANAEFDLALTIAKPQVERDAAAAELVERIGEKRRAAELLRRRRKIVNSVLGLMVVALLLTGAYVARNRYDIMADLLMDHGEENNRQTILMRVKQSIDRLHDLTVGILNNISLKKASMDNPDYADLRAMAPEIRSAGESLLSVLAECSAAFNQETWQTPGKMNRMCIALRNHVPEIEAGIHRITALRRSLPRGKASDGFRDAVDALEKDFITMTDDLYRIPIMGEALIMRPHDNTTSSAITTPKIPRR